MVCECIKKVLVIPSYGSFYNSYHVTNPLFAGLVYLNLRNETKRALLPNEVTSMDTVRALFVRSFPERLSMRWFEEHPLYRIYVRAAGTDLFYELEDLRYTQVPCGVGRLT